MPSVREFGSRRLMANPGAGDKCANATAAMRDRYGARWLCWHAPRMRDMPYFEALRRNRGQADYRSPAGVVTGLARRDPVADGDAMPRSSCARLLRLVGRGLLAFGHELLSLLAVQALAIGFLRAFERRCGTRRLVGLLFRRRRFCSRSGGGRGLCERGAHQEQGRDNGCGGAGRYCHHGKHLGLKKSATSRWDAEPKMNAAAQAVVWRHYIFHSTTARSVVTRRRRARMGSFKIA